MLFLYEIKILDNTVHSQSGGVENWGKALIKQYSEKYS